MIRLSGRRPGTDVEIRIGGVRPGEKLHEELRVPEEALFSTDHPSVLRLEPVIPDPGELARRISTLRRLAEDDAADELRAELLERGPEPNFVIEDGTPALPSPRGSGVDSVAEGSVP